MSLRHVPKDERLSVAMGYLRAVGNRIKAGDIPKGQPLYSEDVLEYFTEIFEAENIIKQQAQYILELQQENTDIKRRFSDSVFADKLHRAGVTGQEDKHETEESTESDTGDARPATGDYHLDRDTGDSVSLSLGVQPKPVGGSTEPDDIWGVLG